VGQDWGPGSRSGRVPSIAKTSQRIKSLLEGDRIRREKNLKTRRQSIHQRDGEKRERGREKFRKDDGKTNPSRYLISPNASGVKAKKKESKLSSARWVEKKPWLRNDQPLVMQHRTQTERVMTVLDQEKKTRDLHCWCGLYRPQKGGRLTQIREGNSLRGPRSGRRPQKLNN